MSDWTWQTWMDALREVQKKAAADPAFRSKAVGDAKGAIRDVSGRAVPEGYRIRFAEAGEEMVIPLPPPAGAKVELSAEELQTVSGGSAYVITVARCSDAPYTTNRSYC
jgi:hypothetical protein